MPNYGDSGIYGRDGGVWKEPTDLQAKNAGAWTNADFLYANKAGTWTLVWARNAEPGATSVPVMSFGSGTDYTATATWTLPGDADLANVKVRWTFDGVAGSWQTLAASATSHSTAAPSGVSASVEVYVVDTGGFTSPTKTATGGRTRLHAVPSLTLTQTGLDRVTATWTHPSGTTRTGYKVTLSDSATVYTETANTTSREFVVAPGTSYTVTVTPVDGLSRNGGSATASRTPSAPAPGTPSVVSWNYSQVVLTWTNATWWDEYQVERSIGTGVWSVVATGVGLNTYTASVEQDTNYRFRIRARGTIYFSAYSGIIYPAIGRPAYTQSDPYTGTNSSVNLYANSSGTGSLTGSAGVNVPSNVTITSMVVNLSCTFATSLFCQWSNRDAYYVVKGVVGSKVPQKANPWSETVAFSQSGAGFAGILLVGTGWSWVSTGGYRATGTITVKGTQTVSYPAVANSYW